MPAHFMIFNELTTLLKFIHAYTRCLFYQSSYIYQSLANLTGKDSQPNCNNLPNMLALYLMLSGTYFAKD